MTEREPYNDDKRRDNMERVYRIIRTSVRDANHFPDRVIIRQRLRWQGNTVRKVLENLVAEGWLEAFRAHEGPRTYVYAWPNGGPVESCWPPAPGPHPDAQRRRGPAA